MFEFASHMPVGAVYFLFGMFGLLWGSFANVVIIRLPMGKNIALPKSACMTCQQKISWYDNIPLLSWLVLRGKCRACKATISWQYPLVELLVGVAFVLVYHFYGFSWNTIEYIIFSFGLIIVSFIDFEHMILPDSFTLSGIVLGLLGALVNPSREFLTAVTGVVFGGGFLWAIAYVYYCLRKQDGMGGGDIKLLAWIGAVLGWKAIPFVILSSSLIGSIVGIAWGIKTKEGMKTSIPFGPYLACAALVYIFGGKSVADWYLNLFIIQ